MSKHIVGSIWRGVNSQNDKFCHIWLFSRDKNSETWMWRIVNKDVKVLDAGIANSYNACLKDSNFNSQSEKKVIFEKIK